MDRSCYQTDTALKRARCRPTRQPLRHGKKGKGRVASSIRTRAAAICNSSQRFKRSHYNSIVRVRSSGEERLCEHRPSREDGLSRHHLRRISTVRYLLCHGLDISCSDGRRGKGFAIREAPVHYLPAPHALQASRSRDTACAVCCDTVQH